MMDIGIIKEDLEKAFAADGSLRACVLCDDGVYSALSPACPGLVRIEAFAEGGEWMTGLRMTGSEEAFRPEMFDLMMVIGDEKPFENFHIELQRIVSALAPGGRFAAFFDESGGPVDRKGLYDGAVGSGLVGVDPRGEKRIHKGDMVSPFGRLPEASFPRDGRFKARILEGSSRKAYRRAARRQGPRRRDRNGISVDNGCGAGLQLLRRGYLPGNALIRTEQCPRQERQRHTDALRRGQPSISPSL